MILRADGMAIAQQQTTLAEDNTALEKPLLKNREVFFPPIKFNLLDYQNYVKAIKIFC